MNLRVFFRQYPSRHRRENPDKANHCADEDGHGKRDVADFVQIGFFFHPFEHQRRPNGGEHALENQGDGAKADCHRINTQLVQARDILEDKAVNRSQTPIGQVAECQRQAVAQAVPVQLRRPFRMGNGLQVSAQLIDQQRNGQHLGGGVGKNQRSGIGGQAGSNHGKNQYQNQKFRRKLAE